MSTARFYLGLLITICLCGLSIVAITSYADVGEYSDIGWYAMVLFMVMCVTVFHLTELLEQATKKTGFISLIMANMFCKMVFSAVLVTAYYVKRAPDDGLFIMPFISVYVLFTIFETYFMNEQARS